MTLFWVVVSLVAFVLFWLLWARLPIVGWAIVFVWYIVAPFFGSPREDLYLDPPPNPWIPGILVFIFLMVSMWRQERVEKERKKSQPATG